MRFLHKSFVVDDGETNNRKVRFGDVRDQISQLLKKVNVQKDTREVREELCYRTHQDHCTFCRVR